jgi:transglutaminase-like putative cysteine protease
MNLRRKYNVTHRTTYTYFEPVSVCHNVLRLAPRNTGSQICARVAVRISPEPNTIREYEDFFGNKVIYFSIEKEHARLTVDVQSEVEIGIEAVGPGTGIGSRADGDGGGKGDGGEIRQFVFETPMTAWNEEIEEYARVSFLPGRPLPEAAGDLMRRIYTDFEFTPGFTTISTPVAVVMKERKGVCQDYAHLAIACIRSVGLPARYVSGYIETVSPAGQEKLIGADASHAWFSVYDEGMGWMDFDPTNNMIPGDQHITIGWGRDYADIAPMKGIILSSGSHGLKVSVDVKRLA